VGRGLVAAFLAFALFGRRGLAQSGAQAKVQPPAPAPTPAAGPLGGAAPASPLSGTLPAPTLKEAAPDVPATVKIVQIIVQGGKTVAPETIGYYLGIKAGDFYDAALIKRNFFRLWDSGLFEDVRIEKEDVPGGVNLVAFVVERPTVADLEFRGNKKLTTSQLKDKLKEGKAEIKVGGPVSLRDVAKAKSVLLDAYKAEGFRSAAVDTTLEAMSPQQRRVVFLVDEGDKVKIESITFTGNTVVGQQKLRNAMKKTKMAHWWRFFDSKSTYNQASYEEDVESLRKVYQDAGYKDVVVKDAVIDVYVTNPEEKRPEKLKRRARVTIPIAEGDRFYFSNLTVEGTTLFEPKILERFFAWKAGKPASRAVIADGTKAIDTVYRSRGYIYVFMNPEFTEKPGHQVDVLVKVTEGDQYKLGRVEFVGNKTTRDKVLRREVQLFEGDTLDMETFRKSLFKITQLGYFKIEEDPDFKVNPEKKVVDVTIKGTDTNRNEVQFGAGYSQLDGLFGQFQFSTRNFLGRGDTLGLQFQRGNRSNFLDLSFSEPWFLDERMSVGGAIFNRGLNYLDVDQKSKGVNLSLGIGLGIFDIASVFYGYTDTTSKYQVFPPPAAPGSGALPPAFENFHGRTSSVTPGYRYDSRNDPMDPSRGRRYGLSLTVAGGPLGGDFSFLKPGANLTWYFPASKKSHLAINAELGYILPYGKTPAETTSDLGITTDTDPTSRIPIFERFRIGGDRSIRGFTYGAIFPLNDKDQAYFDSNGALLGGDKFAVFNIEYVYYVAGPLKIAAFFDAGNAWIEHHLDARLRASTGLELRVFLPIFQAPLRFIYGINLNPKIIKDASGQPLSGGEEKRTDFQFSIGTTF
jgi:outer membrane protein insertion porin family